MDLDGLRFPESENHIFGVWSVCVSVVSITKKQLTAETSKLVYRCDLKSFMKIGQKLCVQGHTKEF